MKKQLTKILCTICVVFALVCCTTTQIVSASDNGYKLLGDGFSQGIDEVTCKNNVNGENFPILYAAIEAAIVDWDWHLGLLNEQYGKNWDMTSVSEANAMIEFYAMSNEEAYAFLETYTGNADELDSSKAANTTCWAYLTPDNSIKWNYCTIIFLYENLALHGVLENYYTLQIIANHEIGHALGLDDYVDEQGNPLDNGVIMHPHYNTCTADVPTAADLNGIYAIYG